MVSDIRKGDHRIEVISSVVSGEGNPMVVLLHGWGGSEESLKSISDRIVPYRKTMRLALPGFGKSPEPPVPWNSSDYAGCFEQWLQAQPGAPFDIIAHSFGGRPAIIVAARRPDLVGRLVLIGSAGIKPKRSLKVKLKIASAKGLRKIGQVLGAGLGTKITAYLGTMGSEDYRAASPVMRGTLSRVIGEDLSAELRLIKQPTLLIWGESDTATPAWMGERMHNLIPNSRLVEIKKAGHYAFLDQPGKVISEIWIHLQLPELW